MPPLPPRTVRRGGEDRPAGALRRGAPLDARQNRASASSITRKITLRRCQTRPGAIRRRPLDWWTRRTADALGRASRRAMPGRPSRQHHDPTKHYHPTTHQSNRFAGNDKTRAGLSHQISAGLSLIGCAAAVLRRGPRPAPVTAGEAPSTTSIFAFSIARLIVIPSPHRAGSNHALTTLERHRSSRGAARPARRKPARVSPPVASRRDATSMELRAPPLLAIPSSPFAPVGPRHLAALPRLAFECCLQRSSACATTGPGRRRRPRRRGREAAAGAIGVRSQLGRAEGGGGGSTAPGRVGWAAARAAAATGRAHVAARCRGDRRWGPPPRGSRAALADEAAPTRGGFHAMRPCPLHASSGAGPRAKPPTRRRAPPPKALRHGDDFDDGDPLHRSASGRRCGAAAEEDAGERPRRCRAARRRRSRHDHRRGGGGRAPARGSGGLYGVTDLLLAPGLIDEQIAPRAAWADVRMRLEPLALCCSTSGSDLEERRALAKA